MGYGVPIHAADSGSVIYATWMGGYGNVIIIDHGNGISTLYAHQSSLAVGAGAHVGAARWSATWAPRGSPPARTSTSRCASTATRWTPWATCPEALAFEARPATVSHLG